LRLDLANGSELALINAEHACCSTVLGNVPTLFNNKRYVRTCMPEHLNKAVNAKELNLASHEVADARLGHAEQLSRPRLSQTALLDQFAQTDHEVGANAEVLGFVVREPEVTKNVAGRATNSHGHSFLPGLAANSQQLGVPSSRQFDITRRSLLRPFIEGVQDVDCLSKLRHVEHPILLSRMNPYLDNP